MPIAAGITSGVTASPSVSDHPVTSSDSHSGAEHERRELEREPARAAGQER